MAFFNLIRWKNLLLIVLAQFLVKYALLEPFGVSTSLDATGFALLVLSTVFIAAAGNIINDIYDMETDAINKPNRTIVGKRISEKMAYNLFIAFNVIGVSIGYIVSYMVNRTGFFALFVIISILLYLYASYLKRTVLIGNLIISALVALSLAIVGIFEIIPAVNADNKATQWFFFKIILDYALFAFMINIIREIAKDIEDIDGDYKAGMKTLPIIIGRSRAKTILIVVSFIPLASVLYYTASKLYRNQIATFYFIFLVIAPMLYTCVKIFNAKSKMDYNHIGNMLKLVMLLGVLSLLLYKYVIL